MASSFSEPRPTRALPACDDTTWLLEISAAEYAINLLLDAKKQALQADPQHEHVLWIRYADRLRQIKRKMDAVCM
jgi:hypothetical protein